MAGRKRGASRAEYSDPEDEGRTMLGEGIEPLPGGGGIYKSAAVAVLRQERKLMTTGEITRLALERHIIVGNVKTPDSTMASALYTDVKRKRERSVFTRPQEGLFGLREWIDEGFFPDGWVGPLDGLGPSRRTAPFRKYHARVGPAVHGSSGRAPAPRPSSQGRPPRGSGRGGRGGGGRHSQASLGGFWEGDGLDPLGSLPGAHLLSGSHFGLLGSHLGLPGGGMGDMGSGFLLRELPSRHTKEKASALWKAGSDEGEGERGGPRDSDTEYEGEEEDEEEEGEEGEEGDEEEGGPGYRPLGRSGRGQLGGSRQAMDMDEERGSPAPSGTASPPLAQRRTTRLHLHNGAATSLAAGTCGLNGFAGVGPGAGGLAGLDLHSLAPSLLTLPPGMLGPTQAAGGLGASGLQGLPGLTGPLAGLAGLPGMAGLALPLGGGYDLGGGQPAAAAAAPGGPRVSSGGAGQQAGGGQGGYGAAPLDSPLHVLGDAVLSAKKEGEREGPAGGAIPGSGSRRKRERPRPDCLQLPTSGQSGLQQSEGTTPKSPFEDGLVALHEVATSPHPFGPPGVIDLSSREDRRRKPRLLLDVGDGGRDGGLCSAGGLDSLGLLGLTLGGLGSGGAHGGAHGLQGFTPLGLNSAHGLAPHNMFGLASPPNMQASHYLCSPRVEPGLQGPPQGIQHLGVHRLETFLLPPGHPPISGPIHSRAAANAVSLLARGTEPSPPTALLHTPSPNGCLNHSSPTDLTAQPPVKILASEQPEVDAQLLQSAAERLEAKLGKGDPVVGKAWLAVARMWHSLGQQQQQQQGGGEVGGGMLQAALRAGECLRRVREAAAAAARQLQCSHGCGQALDSLRERLDQLVDAANSQAAAATATVARARAREAAGEGGGSRGPSEGMGQAAGNAGNGGAGEEVRGGQQQGGHAAGQGPGRLDPLVSAQAGGAGEGTAAPKDGSAAPPPPLLLPPSQAQLQAGQCQQQGQGQLQGQQQQGCGDGDGKEGQEGSAPAVQPGVEAPQLKLEAAPSLPELHSELSFMQMARPPLPSLMAGGAAAAGGGGPGPTAAREAAQAGSGSGSPPAEGVQQQQQQQQQQLSVQGQGPDAEMTEAAAGVQGVTPSQLTLTQPDPQPPPQQRGCSGSNGLAPQQQQPVAVDWEKGSGVGAGAGAACWGAGSEGGLKQQQGGQQQQQGHSGLARPAVQVPG